MYNPEEDQAGPVVNREFSTFPGILPIEFQDNEPEEESVNFRFFLWFIVLKLNR